MSHVLLEMKQIEKHFGKVVAIADGQLQVRKGEVHALLGANGAGKSTLIKILSGVYTQDRGTILLEGQEVNLKSPKEAKAAGIFTVYQEVDTAIVPELSVAENIMLDTFSSTNRLWVSKKKLEQQAKKALEILNAESLDLSMPAFQLTLAEKQLLLIARALVHDAKLIIFDEPTAPLSVTEANRLFQVIEKLKKQDVASIFISHRLSEVFAICDRITIMREGCHVKTVNTSQITQEQVIESMLGKGFANEQIKDNKNIGEPLLIVDNLQDSHKVRNVSLRVSQGEIVGVVGLVGAGKTELAKLLFGVIPATAGRVKLHNKTLRLLHPRDAIKAGIVLVPEERRKEGLFIEEAISTNVSFSNLNFFSKGPFIRRKLERKIANQVIEKLRVKAISSETPLMHLSGGNQQKVAIGKWLSHNAHVYLFDEPTKGVDIGAKVDIFNIIRSQADEGKGVLYLSSEIHEILMISDRILVMYDGQIVKELSREEATQEKILLYASGGKEEHNEREELAVFI